MIEVKEKMINGDNYVVTQLPARRAIKLKAKLIRLFGPVLAQIFISDSDEDVSGKTKLVKAVEVFASHLDENVFENLIVEILAGVRKNGIELTPPTIDLEFAGDMATLYQVIFFVIEVNFSNFLSLFGIGTEFPENPIPTTDTKKSFMRK